jgi:hypothetical protein
MFNFISAQRITILLSTIFENINTSNNNINEKDIGKKVTTDGMAKKLDKKIEEGAMWMAVH